MARIILIESSTSLCSVAVSENGRVIAYRENGDRKHAALTAPLIDEVLRECGLTAKECDAVAVSMGPGSYTGLRVGVSSAKGLCFGAGLPLVAVATTEVLLRMAVERSLLPEGCRHIVPMIDARRMEVYSAVYDVSGEMKEKTSAVVVGPDSFSGILGEGPVLFIGDGAGKCEGTVTSENASFVQICPDAGGLAVPAYRAYEEKRFEDIAYFEPFYLKDFVATVSGKRLF